MKSQRIVERPHDVGIEGRDQVADAFDRNGPNLFGLRLGVMDEPRSGGGEQHLERVQPLGVRRDRYDRDDPAPQPLRSRRRC